MKEKSNNVPKENKFKIFEIIILVLLVVSFTTLILSGIFNLYQWIQNVSTISMLVLSILVVVIPLIKKERLLIEEIIIVVVCFAFLIAAIIVFSSVATGLYRDPIIQISSSCTGGLLALYGIGITIKYTRIDKEAEELKRAKPNVFPVSRDSWANSINVSKLERQAEICEELSTNKAKERTSNGIILSDIYLVNSDISMCTFKGVRINGHVDIVFKYDLVILKGSFNSFKITYRLEDLETIDSFELILGDMIDNLYTCDASFEIKRYRKDKVITVKGALKTEMVDKRLFYRFK